MQTKTLLLAGIAATAVILSGVWLLGPLDKKTSQVSRAEVSLASADEPAPPPPLPYEFLSLPGLQRGDPEREFVVIPSISKKLPFTRLSTLVSADGEDQVAFLHRVREQMVDYSERQTFEACGEICKDGARHAVIMTSISAVAYCAVKSICPQGYRPTRQSIHSHCPSAGRLRATIADEYLSGGALTRRKTFARCSTEVFSDMDFSGQRPGWLAGRRALYRHDGPGAVQAYHPAPGQALATGLGAAGE